MTTFHVHDGADKSDPANDTVVIVRKDGQTWTDLTILQSEWDAFAKAIIEADTIRQMP